MNLKALPGVILDDKYRIDRLLGQGGMGAVFVATHLGTTRTVAVKVIVPQLASEGEFLLRFQREAEAAGRLRHPNVVNVTDFGFTTVEGGQLAYLVMEYLDGETLSGFLKKSPRPPRDLTLDIIDQIALGLEAAHEAGIVHRDLKPDNIWLESNRRGGYNVKVLDFGIAKLNNAQAATVQPRAPMVPALASAKIDSSEANTLATSGSLTSQVEPDTQMMPATAAFARSDQSEAITIATSASESSQPGSLRFTASTLQTTVGSVLGTPAFMAPEQCQGALTIDHRADIYSLATIAYQLFCGRVPFEGARNLRDLLDKQINATPPAPRELDKSIDAGISATIVRGLAKDPGARQNRAGTFAAQLRSGAQGETGFLGNGKFYANTYTKCFLPLLIFCFMGLTPVIWALVTLASALAARKVLSATVLVILTSVAGFLIQVFSSHLYKAAVTLVFEDAAAVGYFRLNLIGNVKKLLRGLGPMLGMYLATIPRFSLNAFLEASLWPTVWAAEGLTGRAGRERARTLAATQIPATLALIARQYGLMTAAALSSPTMFVSVNGSFDDYAGMLFGGGGFSYFLMFYPFSLAIVFLAFGPAFDFLYRSARQCLGEKSGWSLPSGGGDKRTRSAPWIKPATLFWITPAMLMIATLLYRGWPSRLSDRKLIDAAADGRRAVVLQSIDGGVAVDTRDGRGRTPLMQAAAQGDVEGVRQLLARGANLNAQMNSGVTPLMLAVMTGHTEAATALLEHKPAVNMVNQEGRTALIWSALRGNLEISRLLLNQGADKTKRDEKGKTAWDYATEEGYQDVAALVKP